MTLQLADASEREKQIKKNHETIVSALQTKLDEKDATFEELKAAHQSEMKTVKQEKVNAHQIKEIDKLQMEIQNLKKENLAKMHEWKKQ